MGGGVSNSRPKTLFVNSELVEGSKYLGGDGQFREIFIDYVKSGQWAERLSAMILEERKKDFEDNCADSEADLLMGYSYPEDSVCEMPEFAPKGKLVRGPKISKTTRNLLSESFMLANCKGFSAKQLESIMFSILYPLFASTPDDEDTPRSSSYTRTADSSSGRELNQSQRAQEILCACSERSSEEEMHDFLQSPEWVFDTSDTFDSFPLSVSICDTSKPGCPIVYVNKAFEALSGYALGELAGYGLEILHGGDTQAKQVLLLKEAVATGRAAKVAVTHYNKKQKAFLDLVAVRPSAHYSVAVHFSSSPGCYPEDLKMVDDLMLLISCVLQAPLQKSPTRTTSTLHNHCLTPQARKVSSGSFTSVSSISRMLAAHHGKEVHAGADLQMYMFMGSHSGKSLPPGPGIEVPPLVF